MDFLYGTWEMLDIILKLLLAALCGGLVGIQRSNKMSQVNMPAGVIACLSASLFIIIIVRLDYILHIGIENIGIDSDKQKTQFYRFTSHELKSPIIAIKTAIDSVKKNCLDQLDERPLNLLERASLRCDQMLEIIKELLELSKNRSLSDNIKSEEIKIQELLNMVIQAEIIKAEERKIKVITNFDSRDPVVLGQISDFEKIFTNLVSNAIRYNKDNGEVRISARSIDNDFEIQIQDTGIGIPEADISKIFSEFYRSENARKIINFGTGLGLSLVKQIIESYQGTIQVESKLGEGSVFVIKFPVIKYKN